MKTVIRSNLNIVEAIQSAAALGTIYKICKERQEEIAESDDAKHALHQKCAELNISLDDIKRAMTAPSLENIDKDGTGKLTIANFQAFLKREGIQIRLDELSRTPKFNGVLSDHNRDYYTENASTIFRDKLQTELKGVTLQTIDSLILLEACDHPFNPVLEKLHTTQYDGKDRITEIFQELGIDDDLSMIAFRKWLYQCYCGLHNSKEKPFSLDICLILRGSQGAGKTRFFEKLAIDTSFFGEGVALDPTDKDSVIHSTSTWICELGEVSSTLSRDMDRLKAFISTSKDRYRPPYGRIETSYPRRTSFCGSTNEDMFLTDTTGNRRFAVISLNKEHYINMKWVKNFDSVQLWKQIQEEVEEAIRRDPEKSYANIFRLTQQELRQLALRNAEYSAYIAGEEEVRDILSMLEGEQVRRMTATEFIQEHSSLSRYKATQITKVLKKLGFADKVAKVGGTTARVYELPSRCINSIS